MERSEHLNIAGAQRFAEWRRIQTEISNCRDCCIRWPDKVVQPLREGELPDPPKEIDILFIGVAPTPQNGPFRGGHFYSSETDSLRVGLFKLLAEEEFGIPLVGCDLSNGNLRFHSVGCFFLHAAKVRPCEDSAPPKEAIAFCVARHLRQEILLLRPRALCFLGKNNAAVAARVLFGRKIGHEPEVVSLQDWTGLAAVAHQPRRGWDPKTRHVLRDLWRTRRIWQGGRS